MRWLDPGLTRAILCGLAAAGIVHICVTLATPQLSGTTAYERVAARLPVNSLVTVGVPTPKTQLLPYQEPDMQFAFCNYDVSRAPVQIRALLPGGGWTLALYSPAGDNFYIVPGQDQRTVEVNALLVASGDETALMPPDARAPGSGVTYVHVPAPHGLMIIRAPLRGESYAAETAALLSRMVCAPAHRTTASGS